MNTLELDFEIECETLRDMFLKRGYPLNLMEDLMAEVIRKIHSVYFKPILYGNRNGLDYQQNYPIMLHTKENMENLNYNVSFTTTFSTDANLLRDILNKNWALISEDTSVRNKPGK